MPRVTSTSLPVPCATWIRSMSVIGDIRQDISGSSGAAAGRLDGGPGEDISCYPCQGLRRTMGEQLISHTPSRGVSVSEEIQSHPRSRSYLAAFAVATILSISSFYAALGVLRAMDRFRFAARESWSERTAC
jgi:hypothetical protein